MKNLLFLLMTMLCSSLITNAQSNDGKGYIHGRIKDANNEIIEYASATLMDLNEVFVQGTVSDENGYFEFENLAIDNYIIDFQYLGFKKEQINVSLTKKDKKMSVGLINLIEDSAQLEEVVVSAEKSAYNLRLDKKVFNVGEDVISQGGSAIDVLDQVPLVTVTPTGAVTLRGSSDVQILINGKRSGLTMNNALDQISSENIERVEVITNPSSKFDANGSAGIINIILKKNKGLGWNGQIRATLGTPAEHTVMPGVNYKGEKLNLFGNLRWRYSDYNGTYSTNQQTTENGLTNLLKLNQNEDRHDDGRSGYFGGDYYFNDKNSITLAYFRAETKDTDMTELNYNLSTEGNNTNELLRTGNSVENRNYNQLEFNYSHDFEEKNHQLTVDFQYDFWNSTKDWNLFTEGGSISENIGKELRTNNIAGSKDFAFKTDYTKPMKENAALETGLKIENRIVNNEFLAETLNNENWTVFNDINNAVDYGEKIAAAYMQFHNTWKAIEYQVG